MKILFISRWFPYPPDNGSKIRAFNLIKQLASHHEIDLISFTGDDFRADQREAIRQYCQSIETTPFRSFHPNGKKALVGYLSWQPRSEVDTYNPEMQNLVAQAARRKSFDLVIASELGSAPYALAVPGVPKILDELQLTVFYEQFAMQPHMLKKGRYWLTWLKWSHYVSQLLNSYQGCTIASAQELKRCKAIAPRTCAFEVVSNGVDVNSYVHHLATPKADTLIYSGALTFDANFDAVDYFLREIFAFILAERPEVKLLVTGKTKGVPLDRLPINSHSGVTFTGYLDDIRPAVAQSWLSIVPLRVGGGTRLKILESLALGTPVVTTSKGAEGLDLVPGRDLLIADTPTDFATAVLNLLQDPGLRETLSSNGQKAVAARYDWGIIGDRFNHFVEQVAAGKAVSTLS